MHLRIITRNIFSNWTGYLITSAIAFFLSPFIVHHLGAGRYGVWTLVLSMTGYFGMLDLGIRSSVGRFVGRSVALNDEAGVNRTLSCALAILAGSGVLALLATLAVWARFDTFKVDAALQAQARAALLIAGLNIAIVLPMGVFGSVLVALERFDVLTGITLLGAILRSALVVLVLRNGGGLVELASVALLTNSMEYTATALWSKGLYRKLKPSWALITRAGCRELSSFGVYRFIWIVANQLIFYTDSVVIGIYLNAGVITYYAIAGSLINYGRTIVGLATDTLYPTATRLDSREDLAGLRELQVFGTRIALLMACPLCLGYFFLGRQFITLWMGKDYAISAVYLTVLAIPQVASMAQYTSALVLAAMAKHKLLAWLAVSEGAVNLLLSIVLVQRYGLIGVAWGTVIPHLVMSAVVIPAYTVRVLHMSFREYLLRAYPRPLLAAVPVGLLYYAFSILAPEPSWLGIGAEALAVGGTLAVAAYFTCLTGAQKQRAQEKIRGMVRREVVVQ